jgi:hypothetical protein
MRGEHREILEESPYPCKPAEVETSSVFCGYGMQKGRHDQFGVHDRRLILNAALIRKVFFALILIRAPVLAYSYIDSRGVLLFRAEYIISHYVSPRTLSLIVCRQPAISFASAAGKRVQTCAVKHAGLASR